MKPVSDRTPWLPDGVWHGVVTGCERVALATPVRNLGGEHGFGSKVTIHLHYGELEFTGIDSYVTDHPVGEKVRFRLKDGNIVTIQPEAAEWKPDRDMASALVDEPDGGNALFLAFAVLRQRREDTNEQIRLAWRGFVEPVVKRLGKIQYEFGDAEWHLVKNIIMNASEKER